MTLVNRLIKEAKTEPRPTELLINSGQVREIAAHVYSIMWGGPDRPTIEKIEEMIRDGKMRMLDIPVRVRLRRG